jgi:hypothetical protein
MKKQFGKKALLGVALLGFGASVQAIPVPITGTIDFGAHSATVNNSFPAGTETKFLTINMATVEPGTATGSYAPLTGGEAVTFTPFTFTAITPSTPLDLWKIISGGVTYNFEATDVSFIFKGNDFLDISGSGYATITGGATHYAQTEGTWSITDTKSGNSAITFSSALAINEPVPDGGLTVSMLGAGLVGCALFARKTAKLI